MSAHSATNHAAFHIVRIFVNDELHNRVIENAVGEDVEVLLLGTDNRGLHSDSPFSRFILKAGKASRWQVSKSIHDPFVQVCGVTSLHVQVISPFLPGTYRIVPKSVGAEIDVSCERSSVSVEDKDVKLHCFDEHFRALFPFEPIIISPNPYARMTPASMQEILLRGAPVKLHLRDVGADAKPRLYLVRCRAMEKP